MRRIGVLGTAKIVRRAIVQPALAQVVAVASRALERAELVVREIPGARAVEGYQALLDASDVEAVYIALPPALHAAWAEKAAAAGKHVLVEKPLARSVQEVDRVSAAARASGVAVLEAMPLDVHPWPGALAGPGPVEMLECQLVFGVPPAGNFRRELELGGGTFWDAAPYFAALVDIVFCRPAFTTARASASGWESFKGELALEGGRRATLRCSFGDSHVASVRVRGPAGEITHQSFLRPVAGAFPVNLHQRRPDGTRTTISFPPSAYANAQLEAFLGACRRGYDEETTNRVRRRTMILEALWAARGGAP